MPWLVGIDEAGYGPNLGPLVQAAIAVRAPTNGCLWRQLQPVVRKIGPRPDGRIIIDDSKLIFTQHTGLARLEYGLYAILHDALRPSLGSFIQSAGGQDVESDLAHEAWYDAQETGPIDGDMEEILVAANRFHEIADALGIQVDVLGIYVTTTPRFNQLVDQQNSKAGPAANGLMQLLRRLHPNAQDDPMTLVVDKQGGRNAYAPLLQSALPDCWIRCERESAECSEYSTTLNETPIRFRFIPRADQESFPVALTSMLAKYLRERFMRQFNRYWQKHVPGVRPTAGYPLDAKRFYAEIRPAMAKLNLSEELVWRKR